jgi:hypothetical protein
MSGFGGGFGFGSTPGPAQAQTQAPFGSQPPASGFGGNGFGAPAPAASFGGGGFGSSPPPSSSGGFGQPPPAPTGGFGSPPAPTFGSAAAPAPGFGSAPAIPFGNSQPAVSQPFGMAPNVPAQTTNFGFSSNVVNTGFGQPSSGFGSSTSNNTGFGNDAAASGSGFGNSSSGFGNSSSGFGSNTGTPSDGFGNVSAGFTGPGTDHSGPPFGSTAQNSGFGPSSTPVGPFNNNANNNNNTLNPFGAAPNNTTPLPAVSFGASSNVVTTPSVGFGASSSSSAGWGTGTGTGAPAPTGASFGANPFGNSYDAGMQQQSDNEDMGDRTASPFSQHTKFGSAPSTEMTTGGLRAVPEETNMAESSSPVPPFGGVSKSGEEMRLRAKMEEKKLLQAKIDEKKRKLLERQKMKKSQAKDNTPLNAEAVPFVPSAPSSGASSGDTERSSLRFGSQSGASSADASLAERNALRFGSQTQSSSTRSYMPAHLRGKAEQSTTTENENSTIPKDTNREELENAVSLVGTCQYMCPDDELLRREREGDIQQLETPQPGTLHPENWSLRETTVKRFRRSAADYKLDVPEWVRPPDVLEKVCGYLEEWVMVRCCIVQEKTFLVFDVSHLSRLLVGT